jgi:hypothetical protein
LVAKLVKILSSFPHKTNYIIYFEHPLKKNLVFEENEIIKQACNVVPLSNLEKYGAQVSEHKDAHEEGECFFLHMLLYLKCQGFIKL